METLREEYRRKGIICAVWCIDSETGKHCLIDLYDSSIIAYKVDGKIVDPSSIIKC